MVDEMGEAVREAVEDLLTASQDGLSAEKLVEFGWTELYEEDPRLAVAALFEGLGRQATASNAIDVVAALALSENVEKPMAVLFETSSGGPGASGRGNPEDAVPVDGLLTPGSHLDAGLLLIRTGGIGAATARRVAVRDSPEVNNVSGVDPRSGWSRITALARTEHDYEPQQAVVVLAAIRRALAHELLGVSRQMLAVASEHVTSRQQFGRAIGSYQAVRHRLADVHIANELTESVLDHAWSGETAELAYATAVAKSLATSAFDKAMRHCMQVCGGMGFTEEFPLAPLIRRGLALAPLFGSAATLETEVGEFVIRSQEVPRLGDMASTTSR